MLKLNPTVRNKIISNVVFNGAVSPQDYTASLPDEWMWMEKWQNEYYKGKAKQLRKNFPSATLSTTNPTWTGLRMNPDVQCKWKVTNHLIHGADMRKW
jgi:hypothetical protein